MPSQLKRDFELVVKHYGLSDEAIVIAKHAIRSSPIHAARCYRAIANSLIKEA